MSESEKPTPDGAGVKALKGCGKEGRILSVAATIIAAKANEWYGIDLGPQEISVLGLSLFVLAQRLETYLGK